MAVAFGERLTAEQVKEQCSKEAKRSMEKMAKLRIENNPVNELVWNKKYKFFSNSVMKHRHETYAKAQSDPLRGEVTPWEKSFALPEHRWVERQEASEAERTSSPSGEPRPPVGPPGCPSVPNKAGPPILQPTASDEALTKTLNMVNKVVATRPRSVQASSRKWSKYHYFAGGGLHSGRFKLQGQEDPWAWALDVKGKYDQHEATKAKQPRAPSNSKRDAPPF